MIRNVQRLLKRNRKKQTSNDKPMPKPQEPLRKSFNENVEAFQSIYYECSDVIFREFQIFGSVRGMIIYIEGLSDLEILDECVIYPLIQKDVEKFHLPKLEIIKNTIAVSGIKQVSLVSDCIESISNGCPILLIETENTALSLALSKYEVRSIEEPQSEKVIRGPREGFIESLQVNTAMVRRIIKSAALKMKPINKGEYTKTEIVLAYIEGVASPNLIEELEERLQRIEVGSVLESGYIEELIEDNPYSPFPQVLSTERPDVVAAQLLEGRAAILLDGTPFALIAPVSFFSMLQAPDDYYERYIFGTVIRWLRYVFIVISLVLPSLFVAITTFHQEMIPDPLLLSIAVARESVPYPALVEVILMELMLEALREAGVRLPNQIGAAVSIVGALVIGQAAVQAGLVSAPMVIVVSTTGIASFLVPRYIIGYSIRFLRFPLVILAGFLGLLGIMLGVLAIIIHLCTLRSFGEPYMQPLAPLKKHELKDVLWRSPFWMMDTRPHFDGSTNVYRQAPGQKPGLARNDETQNGGK